MAEVIINGVVYKGEKIEVSGNEVYIDGASIGKDFSSPLQVWIAKGVVQEVKADGSVHCGEVLGDVMAGGSVKCGDVKGDVQAGGSITANSVGGSMMAGGSIRVG